MRSDGRDPASFRDPSGFVFQRDGRLLRQVNLSYREHYDLLMGSGLYERLVAKELLVPHEELVDKPAELGVGSYKVIAPRRVEFISHPWEWSFSQLKDCALATLEIQKTALEFDMMLKDASSFNTQFVDGKPIFIDTLSFEKLPEQKPWIAYRQFCQHYLAPLALTSRIGPDALAFSMAHIDGIPLDLTSRILPKKTWLNLGLLFHVHLHNRSQKKYADALAPSAKTRGISKRQLFALVDSLEGTVRKLAWKPEGTEWANYYDDTNYADEEHAQKEDLVGGYLDVASAAGAGRVVDLGANTGRYSRLASGRGLFTIAADVDPAAVEKNYLSLKASGEKGLLPLVVDLTSPSPAVGWRNAERPSWIERASADCALALALVHHLAISNNLPLAAVADFCSGLAEWLIIEWVPKDDSQVQRLLRSREDIFPSYTREGFEDAFTGSFSIEESELVSESKRRLYLMRRKS